jgi:hypothetical protein
MSACVCVCVCVVCVCEGIVRVFILCHIVTSHDGFQPALGSWEHGSDSVGPGGGVAGAAPRAGGARGRGHAQGGSLRRPAGPPVRRLRHRGLLRQSSA